MDILSSFLEKFKNIRDPKKDRQEVVSIISEIIKYQLKETEIEIFQNKVRVNALPMLKTQIFLNKEVILDSLNARLPHLKISEIF